MKPFDKSTFKKANANRSGGFELPPEDQYIGALTKAERRVSEAGKEMVMMCWDVLEAAENEDWVGKTIFQNFIFEKEDGSKNNFAYQQLADTIDFLGINPDEAGEDMDGALSAVESSKARFTVKHTKSKTSDTTYGNVKLQKLLDSPLEEEIATKEETEAEPDLQASDMDDKEIEKGVKLLCEIKGQKKEGEVISCNFEEGIICVMVDKNLITITPDDVIDVLTQPKKKEEKQPEIVEDFIEDIEEEIKLEEGMRVKGEYNGEIITGIIHNVADNGIVKVAALNPKTGKKAAFTCKRETIEVIK